MALRNASRSMPLNGGRHPWRPHHRYQLL